MPMCLQSNLQQSTINIRQVLKMVGVWTNMKTSNNCQKFLTRSSQRQIDCANPLGDLPASNLVNYMQLPKDNHEISSNDAHHSVGS